MGTRSFSKISIAASEILAINQSLTIILVTHHLNQVGLFGRRMTVKWSWREKKSRCNSDNGITHIAQWDYKYETL